MKKEEKYSVGRPKLADSNLKKKSVIISCICLVAALALLITGAFELNILKFNSKKLRGAVVNTSLCGDDINIIPEELRYSEANPEGFKDIKFYSAVLSIGGVGNSFTHPYNSSEYCSTITKSDLEQINYLNVQNSELTNVSGIGYLTGLERLYMDDNSIENIDLSKNINLKNVNLNNNNLSSVNINDLSNVTYVDLKNNQLTNVHFSGLTSLENFHLTNNKLTNVEFSGLDNLQNLYLNNNQLSNINLNNLTNLQYLDLQNNQLASIDVSDLANLRNLYLYNNQLTNLNLSNNNQIFELSISNNPLTNIVLDNIRDTVALGVTSLNLNGTTEIENLSIKNTSMKSLSIKNAKKIKNLDISNNSQLASFSIDSEAIDKVVVENIPNLRSLYLTDENINFIKLNNLPKLESLDLFNNKLTSLDLSGLPNLKRLNLNNNNITSIDVSDLLKLEMLRLSDNKLTNIALGGLDNLQSLYLNNNNLTKIEVISSLTNLELLEARKNNLTSLDLSNLSKLSSLELDYNNLKTIKGLSKLKNLKTLNLFNNELVNIDINDLTSLENLILSNNKLNNIYFSNLKKLISLDVSNNNLTEIKGLQELTNLEDLYVHNNRLESIDLSNNTQLVDVTLQNNPLENIKYIIKGKTINYKDIVNANDVTYNVDNESVGTFDGSILKTKEVGTLNVTASAKSFGEWAIDGSLISYKVEFLDKCLNTSNYEENREYCDNLDEEEIISPYFYENKVIVYDVLSNNYKVDGDSKTIDVSGLIPDTKYITLTEGLTGEIKNNKYIVKNSNNEVVEEFTILNPGKKEEEIKEVKTTTKTSSKRVIKPNKRVTTKKLEDINLTGSFISSMMLNKVKGQDRKLTVTNEDIKLTMLGKEIKKVDSNIDISYTITDVKETEVKDKVESGVVLDFVNKTTLPCTSQVEVNVKDKITGTVNIYRYENGTLVLIAENVRITDNKLTFNTDKLDTYVITNKLKKDVEIKEDKTLIENNKKQTNKCLIVIPLLLIIILIGIGTYIYKKKIAK